ncbi:hypothetical protein [Litoribaculum gwangyangense]|uniref:DEAD/DEAH box helicase family protein n=1 Tax=Litoribaculum gwangyangense TaxID=1130722 RepID=A0ABP9C127_9FLAO
MSKIKVYDAIMGSGKTYDAIERMKSYLKDDKSFIYITPFLSEIDRIMDSLPINSVYAPLGPGEKGEGKYDYNIDYCDESGNIDLNSEGSYQYLNKRAQFLKLCNKKRNIVSTHSLFMNLKKDDYSLFDDYILILDEVVNPLNVFNIGAKDIEILTNENLIIIDQETSEVKFIDDEYNDNAFKEVKRICNNSTVFFLDKYFFVWVFPIEIFKGFQRVEILTYLFKGSLLSSYFKMYNIDYKINYNNEEDHLRSIKKLLNVYEGSANYNESLNSFSKTWIKNLNKKNLKKVVNSTEYIFKKVFKTNTEENAFTTFKAFRQKLSGNGYTKGFIPINARATNIFKSKKSMAFLGNRYHDPQTVHFFKERGVILDDDIWALSELLQWVWRGRIRDNKPMNLFIPNSRMRKLLNDWLEGKFVSNGQSNKGFLKAV